MVVLPSFPLKEVQSLVERHPARRSEAVRQDKLFAANDSPLPIEALVTGEVPFPVNIPPSVVEPVPPKLTASVVDPTIFPSPSVVKIDDVIDVNHVAPVFVSIVVDACVKKVDEAMTDAFLSHRPVVVLCTKTLAYESMVHGQVMPVPVSETGDDPRTLNAVHVTDPVQDTEVVATVPKLFAPVQYARLPATGALDVPMPRKSNAPVPELYRKGKTALNDDEEILLLNKLQSPDERYPSKRDDDCVIESVLPEKRSGPEIVAAVIGPVPFPVSIPPSVVEPVPPKLTASVVDPTTLPAESVVRMDEVMEGNHTEERKDAFVVEAFWKYDVEEAIRPLWKKNVVVVACVVVPYTLSVLNGQMNCETLELERHTPLTAKHPAARLMPPAE